MAATYNGKIVVQNYPGGQLLCRLTHDGVDNAIDAGSTFGDLQFDYNPVWHFTFDDGSEIKPEDMVSTEDVPTDADLNITTDIALVQTQST